MSPCDCPQSIEQGGGSGNPRYEGGARRGDPHHVPEQMLPDLGALRWRDWPGAPALGVALTAAIALLPYRLMMAVLVNGGSARYWVPISSLTTVLIVIGLAPAILPARPRYTHMITRTATSATARALPVPPGATELVARGAWRVYALPGWMTLAQIEAR